MEDRPVVEILMSELSWLRGLWVTFAGDAMSESPALGSVVGSALTMYHCFKRSRVGPGRYRHLRGTHSVWRLSLSVHMHSLALQADVGGGSDVRGQLVHAETYRYQKSFKLFGRDFRCIFDKDDGLDFSHNGNDERWVYF